MPEAAASGLEGEIIRETFLVAPQGLVECLRRNLIQGSQIGIEHYSPTPDYVDKNIQRFSSKSDSSKT